jgi:hypothetical protein
MTKAKQSFYQNKVFYIPIEFEERFEEALLRRVPDSIRLPNSIECMSQAIGFVLNSLPTSLEVYAECVEARSQPFFELICEWIERWTSVIPNNADAISVGKTMANDRKKQGRYRLTADEIEYRRKMVKEAEQIKKENPQRLWKEIDLEMAGKLEIAERTFRAWRHNNY